MKVEVKSFNTEHWVTTRSGGGITAAAKAESYINERLGQGWGLQQFAVTTTPNGEPTITVCMVMWEVPASVWARSEVQNDPTRALAPHEATAPISPEEFAANQPHPVSAPYGTPPASPVRS